MPQRLGFPGHSRQRYPVAYSCYHECSIPDFHVGFLGSQLLGISLSLSLSLTLEIFDSKLGCTVCSELLYFNHSSSFSSTLDCQCILHLPSLVVRHTHWGVQIWRQTFLVIFNNNLLFYQRGVPGMTSIFQMSANHGFVGRLESVNLKVLETHLDQSEHCSCFSSLCRQNAR